MLKYYKIFGNDKQEHALVKYVKVAVTVLIHHLSQLSFSVEEGNVIVVL